MTFETKSRLATKVSEWLGQSAKHSQAELSRLSGLSSANISHIASWHWPEKVISDAQWQKLLAFFGQELHIDSANFLNITAACQKAQIQKEVIAVNGYTGAGKTYALRRYVSEHPGTIYIQGDPTMTKRAIIKEIAKRSGVDRLTANMYDMLAAIVEKIKRTPGVLIIFDEIEYLPQSAWHIIKSLMDKLEHHSGFVVSGIYREVLEKMANRQKPGMPQLLRRLGHSWLNMQAISAREVRSFCDENGIDDEGVISMLRRDCQEYARLQRYVKDLLHVSTNTRRPITMNLYKDIF